MSDGRDERIQDFFLADAPPARDPLFRIQVLERREQWQFQRRSVIMAAGVLMILLVSTMAVATGAGSLESLGPLSVGAALASGYLSFRGSLLPVLRRFSL